MCGDCQRSRCPAALPRPDCRSVCKSLDRTGEKIWCCGSLMRMSRQRRGTSGIALSKSGRMAQFLCKVPHGEPSNERCRVHGNTPTRTSTAEPEGLNFSVKLTEELHTQAV